MRHYHIIFMDHMMPGMDGIETFHAMKTLAGNQCVDTPVIILTANVGKSDGEVMKDEANYISLL